jgi:hypothetical protein
LQVGDLKTTSQIIAKKLSVKKDFIQDIKTAEKVFPVRSELETNNTVTLENTIHLRHIVG